MILTDSIFGRKHTGLSGVNTFIGGVGAIISSAEDLAVKLNIPLSNVQNFAINGNDIEAFIDTNYSPFFQNNTSITYYHDVGGNVINLIPYSFASCTSLVSIDFPQAIFSSGNLFRTSTNLSNVNLPLLQNLDSVDFFRCNSITELYLPELLEAMNASGGSTTSGCFREMGGITLIDMPKCSSIGRTNGYNGVFQLMKTGCVINVDASLATNNNGNMDGDLEYAINQRGATVNFINN